jgi:hypothetical protein
MGDLHQKASLLVLTLWLTRSLRPATPLFGSTVQGFGFTYRSLSNKGDIAFAYGLSDGESGIAIARLVPEPSSAILLAVGLAGWWRSRCRRHPFGTK